MSRRPACELGRRGEVKVDEYSRTSAAHIYAIGDVTDRVQLTPVAIHEAMCFVETAFKDNPTKPDHVHVPSAVFTTPGAGGGRPDGREGAGAWAIPSMSTNPRFRPLLHTLGGRPMRAP